MDNKYCINCKKSLVPLGACLACHECKIVMIPCNTTVEEQCDYAKRFIQRVTDLRKINQPILFAIETKKEHTKKELDIIHLLDLFDHLSEICVHDLLSRPQLDYYMRRFLYNVFTLENQGIIEKLEHLTSEEQQ